MSIIPKIDDLQRRAAPPMSPELERRGQRAPAIRAVPPRSGGRARRPRKGYLFAKRAFDIVVAGRT